MSQVDGLVNGQQTDINNGSLDQLYVMDESCISVECNNLNNGKKEKFLYFQSDFELKQ